MNRKIFFRYGAVAAALSVLSLIGMAFISLPRGIEYPGLPALVGNLELNPAEIASYLRMMNLLYLLDGFFLLGWIVGWTALSTLVGNRSRIAGTVMLVLGLAGAFMDLSENSIILGVLRLYESGVRGGGGWVVAWMAVRHLSYWLPFAGAAVGACFLWNVGYSGKFCALCGALLVLPAVSGLYLPALAIFSNLWFLLWFLGCAFVLWKQAAREELAPNA